MRNLLPWQMQIGGANEESNGCATEEDTVYKMGGKDSRSIYLNPKLFLGARNDSSL